MAEKKNFLNWVGFTGEDESSSQPSSVARIRELEAQIADLKSRRDITGLTKEEFEILATETAMSMIKSAQARESKAQAAASRLVAETTRATKEELEAADAKARAILSGAESRGRKYIQTAEAEAEEKLALAEEKLALAEAEAEVLLESKKREIDSLATAARREGERIVAEATTEASGYRQWLTGVISEAERLYRIQKQSLDAAESAIQHSRNRLDGAFQRLEELQNSVIENLNADNTLVNPGPRKVSSQRTHPALEAPSRSVKKTAKKPAKKAKAKKSAANKTAKH